LTHFSKQLTQFQLSNSVNFKTKYKP